MEPLKPMAPMTPMEPMEAAPAWWPGDLGTPDASGGQDGIDYAFFSAKRRLAVRRDGHVTLYDSGDHRITGVSQSGDGPRFASQHGTVDLHDLSRA